MKKTIKFIEFTRNERRWKVFSRPTDLRRVWETAAEGFRLHFISEEVKSSLTAFYLPQTFILNPCAGQCAKKKVQLWLTDSLSSQG